MEKWEPTALEMMLAMNAVLADSPTRAHALFIHASPAKDPMLDEKLLTVASNTYHLGLCSTIILNGLSEKECKEKNLAYCGYESWMKQLDRKDIPERNIKLLPPSLHTGEESRNLLLMAKQMDWYGLIISSYPYHQLRCFLQIIALMEQVGFYPTVHNRTFHDLAWTQPLHKPVLGGGTIHGTLPTHIEEEFKRIVRYSQDPLLTQENYTRHATIPEMLEYLEKRN